MNRKFFFTLSCALVAGLDHLRGRGLAINSAENAGPPSSLFGLPAGIDPEKVLARQAVLVEHGTPQLVAQKIAIDAEGQQVAHDARQLLAAEKAAVLKAEIPGSDVVDEFQKYAGQRLADIGTLHRQVANDAKEIASLRLQLGDELTRARDLAKELAKKLEAVKPAAVPATAKTEEVKK